MSKYTTEVRFICEQKAGLESSAGFTQIDDILDKSWDKIFTSSVVFFDETYKPVLCKKILKHYYTREICAETVGLWQLWLNTRLEEIMPYYNELYKSAQLEFEPFDDVNYTREANRKNTENENSTNNRTISNDSSGSSNSESVDKYSDTPQGSITNLSSDTYMTNARIVSDENSFTSENSGTDNQTNDINRDKNEDYFEKIIGKQGSKNYSEMLLDFRKTFLNIDMQVIEEFSDLFFNLY